MIDAPPRAARLATPRWLDLRLVLGIVAVLVAVVVGARVFAAADHDVPVLAAAHPLVPGERLDASDFAVVRVRLGASAPSYVAAGSPPVGYVVTRYVRAHELVPVAALATGGAVATAVREVTVPVSPGHLPTDLGHGDLVDVYLTVKPTSGGSVPAPTLVASRLVVDSVSGGSTFGGTSTVTAMLDVPSAQVVPLVHAVEAGSLDLVELPAGAAATVLTSAAPTPTATSTGSPR